MGEDQLSENLLDSAGMKGIYNPLSPSQTIKHCLTNISSFAFLTECLSEFSHHHYMCLTNILLVTWKFLHSFENSDKTSLSCTVCRIWPLQKRCFAAIWLG